MGHGPMKTSMEIWCIKVGHVDVYQKEHPSRKKITPCTPLRWSFGSKKFMDTKLLHPCRNRKNLDIVFLYPQRNTSKNYSICKQQRQKLQMAV